MGGEEANGLPRSPAGALAKLPARTELFQRLISGGILAGVALWLTMLGPVSFAVLIAGVIALAAWEYGRLVRGGGFDGAWALQALGTAAAIGLIAYELPWLALAALGLTAVISASLAGARHAVFQAGGVAYLGTPALALAWLRDDPLNGVLAIIFIFLAVWSADTGAFAAGRLFGGPKLWPSLSPNKTWSGAIGGVALAMFAAWMFALATSHRAPGVLALTAALLAIASVLGDLFESGLKRRFGRKDASGLIPGHGGLLDRIDGLLFAALAAGAIAVIVAPGAPGAAVLALVRR